MTAYKTLIIGSSFGVMAFALVFLLLFYLSGPLALLGVCLNIMAWRKAPAGSDDRHLAWVGILVCLAAMCISIGIGIEVISHKALFA